MGTPRAASAKSGEVLSQTGRRAALRRRYALPVAAARPEDGADGAYLAEDEECVPARHDRSGRPGALDDHRVVEARRQRPERASVIAREPRRAERLRDGRIAVPHEERALQRQRHALDDPPRPRLDVGEVAEL